MCPPPWEQVYLRGAPPTGIERIRNDYWRRQKALPFLRRDFRNRCCYCTVHESELLGAERSFDIDHFRSRAELRREGRESDINLYSNLYYACSECNELKWQHPLPDSPPNDRFIDPCCEPLYPEYLRLCSGDHIAPGKPPGPYIVQTLRLDSRVSVHRMIKRREAQTRVDAIQQKKRRHEDAAAGFLAEADEARRRGDSMAYTTAIGEALRCTREAVRLSDECINVLQAVLS